MAEDNKPQIKKIVRLARVDLKGEKKIIEALKGIKGVSSMLSNAIIQTLKLDPNTPVGALTTKQLDDIKNVLDNPQSVNIPSWLLNRRSDLETGEDKHLYGPDIDLQLRFDIKRMQANKSYKGFRHAVGLKVRGQKTKAHPRKGSALGVKKKKQAPSSGGKK